MRAKLNLHNWCLATKGIQAGIPERKSIWAKLELYEMVAHLGGLRSIHWLSECRRKDGVVCLVVVEESKERNVWRQVEVFAAGKRPYESGYSKCGKMVAHGVGRSTLSTL